MTSKPGTNEEGEARLLTIGHSTRAIDVFLHLLKTFGVKRLVDVRSVPRSRHNPQFESDALAPSLSGVGIEYLHMRALGGLRKPRPDSINTGWRNTSFRGYADYMQTEEFGAAVEHLIELAEEKQTVIMCAEAVPWRCHRSLVADAVITRGMPVEHIMSETRSDPHRVTKFAARTGLRITYPPEETPPGIL